MKTPAALLLLALLGGLLMAAQAREPRSGPQEPSSRVRERVGKLLVRSDDGSVPPEVLCLDRDDERRHDALSAAGATHDGEPGG